MQFKQAHRMCLTQRGNENEEVINGSVDTILSFAQVNALQNLLLGHLRYAWPS